MGWLLKIILNGVYVCACTCALACAYVHMACTHSGPQMPAEDVKPCNWSDMDYLLGSWELNRSPLKSNACFELLGYLVTPRAGYSLGPVSSLFDGNGHGPCSIRMSD